MRRLVTTAALIVSIVAAISVPPAAADLTGPRAGGGADQGGGSATAGNGAPVKTSSGSPGSTGASSGPCPPGQTVLWGQSDVIADTPGAGQNGLPVAGSTSTPLFCNGVFQGIITAPPSHGAPTATATQLAQQAVASAPFQPIRVVMSPPSTREAVNFPIFLSLASGFSPVTATAAAGGVTSTVTITPIAVTWNMGDGHSVTCQGPGIPFDPSRPFDSQLLATGLPPCGYQYRTSSANQPAAAYQASVTIHYNATWTVTGAAGGGNLAPVDRSVTISVTVGEIQILNN